MTARIGGDELLAYRPDMDEAAAAAVRQRAEVALREPVERNGPTLRVGVTVGISVSCPGRHSSPDELIAAADAATYERKRLREAVRDTRRGPAGAGAA